jgi:hypothetical protein
VVEDLLDEDRPHETGQGGSQGYDGREGEARPELGALSQSSSAHGARSPQVRGDGQLLFRRVPGLDRRGAHDALRS